MSETVENLPSPLRTCGGCGAVITDPRKKHEMKDCLVHLQRENKALRNKIKLSKGETVRVSKCTTKSELQKRSDSLQKANYELFNSASKNRNALLDLERKHESLLVHTRKSEILLYLMYNFAVNGPDTPLEIDELMRDTQRFLSGKYAQLTIKYWKESNSSLSDNSRRKGGD